MSAAVDYEESEIPWLIRDLPLKTPAGISIEEPRIYYGLSRQGYVITPNETGELDYPEGGRNITYDYRGSGGIPVSSFLEKTIVSRFFNDENIFLTVKTGKDSRLLFRRNIEERIEALLPFLIRDRSPYLTTAAGRLYWITDAYVVSDDYPYSTLSQFSGTEINYIRNSVKIVVDAYNGTVRCYVSDPDDPFAAAYRRIYPDLFRPLDELPRGMEKHLRYPKDFFGLQMKIYARYHQEDPAVFYRGEDVWDQAFNSSGNKNIFEPYYITANIIDPAEADFTLFLPLISKNSGNLRALSAGGCDGNDYGGITVYSLERGQVHFSPSQISAAINQDPMVSQQLTLWDQKGTKISWGSMVLVPSAEGIFYVQPLFIKGTGGAGLVRMIRVIITDGETVVMKKTLKQAFLELINQEK